MAYFVEISCPPVHIQKSVILRSMKMLSLATNFAKLCPETDYNLFCGVVWIHHGAPDTLKQPQTTAYPHLHISPTKSKTTQVYVLCFFFFFRHRLQSLYPSFIQRLAPPLHPSYIRILLRHDSQHDPVHLTSSLILPVFIVRGSCGVWPK